MKLERWMKMAKIKINGIVLTESNLGDFDKMLTVLTPNVGKISCIAKGARRPRSALLAGTQMFCFGEYLLYKGSEVYSINSVEPIEIFYKIRTDLDKLKYAVHINKIINDVTNENQNSYRVLQLLLNTLYTISETDKNLDMVLSVFKLRLLCILGYTPKIEKCTDCGGEENIEYFSIKDDGFKCKNCGIHDTSAISISKSTLNAIRYTIKAPSKKIYSFNLKDNALEEFKIITKLYFNEKLEKEYKFDN